MQRTFLISYTRSADEYERENANTGWYDKEENLIADETSLDSDYEDTDVLIADLMNLFSQFVRENGFENVAVMRVEEVEYDGYIH